MIFMARVADQSERFDDMYKHLKSAIKMKGEDFNSEERNLLSVGFKNLISSNKSAWSTITALKSICLFCLGNFQKQEKECQGWSWFWNRNRCVWLSWSKCWSRRWKTLRIKPEGTIIFINYINIFNSRGQFPSYLI